MGVTTVAVDGIMLLLLRSLRRRRVDRVRNRRLHLHRAEGVNGGGRASKLHVD